MSLKSKMRDAILTFQKEGGFSDSEVISKTGIKAGYIYEIFYGNVDKIPEEILGELVSFFGYDFDLIFTQKMTEFEEENN